MKVQCKICNNATNHAVLAEHTTSWDEGGVWGSDGWYIVKCLGCEDITFKRSQYFSETVGVDGQPEERIQLYPPRGKNILLKKEYYALNDTVKMIYKETVEAFNTKANLLCAAGIRAVIEGICKNEGILSGIVLNKNGGERVSSNLDGKISGLTEKNIITLNHANILHELRFLGNDALHELKPPSRKELQLAIEIIEHTIEGLYEINKKAKELSEASTKRKQLKSG